MLDVNLHIGIPAEIRSLLGAPAVDYGAACDVGTLCAALLVKHLYADPALIGSNRIGAVVERMSALGCKGGYGAGFFALLEYVLAEGVKHVNVDALAIRALGQSIKVRRASAHVLPNGSRPSRKRGRVGV